MTTPVTTSSKSVNMNIHTSTQLEKQCIPAYTYKARVLNPIKKSGVALRDLNSHTDTFENVTKIRM